MTKNYRSGAFAAIHETAEVLRAHGIIDKTTMKEFDESCLAPVAGMTPEEIRRIHERNRLTQEALADVDAGRVIDHQAVQAWADSLSGDEPSPKPTIFPEESIAAGRVERSEAFR